MRKKLFFMIVTSFCILTSCGKTVGTDGNTESNITETAKTTSEPEDQTANVTSVSTEETPTEIKINKNPPDDVILSSPDSIEVYTDMTVAEFITDTNTELLDPDAAIDTAELGEKEVKILFSYNGTVYEKEMKYSVIDTTQPLALNMGWNPYVKAGEPFDLNAIVGYADNYDRSPELTYAGEVNTDEVGCYPITVTVTDNSGNSTSWDMDVLVLNEIPAPEDNNPRVSFSEFKDYYNYENVSYGIDVSAWQTNVDYEAIKAEGCEFVIMRMGYYYDEVKMDDYYIRNMERATAAGLDVGVYFYTTDNTEEGAREHARWIVEQLDGQKLDYPIAFDWEEWGRFQKYGMNINDLNEIFEAFCDELEKNGYTGMLYSSKNFLNNFWENKNNRTVWLAHYVDETDYDGTFAIWQASAYGRISGIEGDVDMNIRINDIPLY